MFYLSESLMFVAIACLLTCFPSQEERVESKTDRLAPARLEKMDFGIVEPGMLEEKDLVEKPETILNNLRDLQQKAWVARKAIKGKAWVNFIGSKVDRSSIWLLEFSAGADPQKMKYLAYGIKRRVGDPFKSLEGLSPDSKDKLLCTQAAARTPEMFATGLFLSQLSNQASDEISIYPPEKGPSTFAELFANDMFRFSGSPKSFYDNVLPEKLKNRYQQRVKKRGELIELSLWRANVQGRPTDLWLFDTSKNGCCVYHYHSIYSVETEFVKDGEYWLPKRSVKRDNKNYYETSFFDIVVNPEFEENEFSALSFPCADKGTVYNKITGENKPFSEFKSDGK